MSRGFPSMTALLGLLAVAGFQNRDKLAELLRGDGGSGGASPASAPGMPGPAGGLGSLHGAPDGQAGAGGLLANGLRELVERFGQAGQAEKARSWIGTGANLPIRPDELGSVIGPEALQELQQRTGLTRDDLLARLSAMLPRAVDESTPEGRVPE